MFNSDDFAKEAEAAAAAEEKKRAEIQEERELAEALRKVEEAQRMLSSEQDATLHGHNEDEEHDMTSSSRKGKGRAAEYSHVEEHSSQQRQEQHSQLLPGQLGDSVTAQHNGETRGNGLEEPLTVSQQDQEIIQQTLDQQSAEAGKGSSGSGGGGKGKGKGKGKGRK